MSLVDPGAAFTVRAVRNGALRVDVLAAGAVVATIALMTLGSVVHGTGSSLACPDWPLCNGSAVPEMTGGVRFEHSHRLAALAVIVLTGALTVAVWRRAGRIEKALAAVACGLVLVQAGLGAATVLLRLPPLVSVAHLATSMAFLAVLVTLGARLAGLPRTRSDGRMRVAFAVAAGLVYVQIVIGGLVRHMGAALACPDLPLCTGIAWPAPFLQRLQMVHRAVGLVAALAVIGTVVALHSRARPRGSLFAVTLAPAILVLGQVALGVAVVATGAPLPVATAHHATGALLLASLMLARASC